MEDDVVVGGDEVEEDVVVGVGMRWRRMQWWVGMR